MKAHEPRQLSGLWEVVIECFGQILGEWIGEAFIGIFGLVGHALMAVLGGIFL